MKRSTALNIYRTAKPMAWRGTIHPMAEHDRALREVLAAMILEHDAGGITLATMREARAILASTGDAA